METNLCTLNDSAKESLLSATKWLKFLTILSSIGLVLMVIFGLIAMVVPSALGARYGALGGMGLIYWCVAALYAYPIIRAFRMIKEARLACLADDQNSFELMFDSMRAILRYMGILAIIGMVAYAVLIIGIVVGAATAVH